jgi:hypothetical protein
MIQQSSGKALKKSVNSLTKTSKQSDLIIFSKSEYARNELPRTHQFATKFARYRRVYYIEPAVFSEGCQAHFRLREEVGSPKILKAHLPLELSRQSHDAVMHKLVSQLIEEEWMSGFTVWMDHPDVWPIVRKLRSALTIWDCENIEVRNENLLQEVDIILTRNQTSADCLRQCCNVHVIEDGVETDAFLAQKEIPFEIRSFSGPRILYHGPTDQRLNFELLERVASIRNQWNFFVLGTGRSDLQNLHFLGPKSSFELPAYAQGMQAAILPLATTALPECGRESLECVAARLPIVASKTATLKEQFAGLGAIRWADCYPEFVLQLDLAVENGLSEKEKNSVGDFLGGRDWEVLWRRFAQLELNTESRSHNKTNGVEKFKSQ